MAVPRIAVFGAGLVGARHVAEAVAQAELCAIADPSPAARELADMHTVPCFDDPLACLDESRPDGVVIATPNHLHADHAVACLSRGVPVLVEKPIAGRLEDAARIVDVAEETGVPVLVGHHRRHNPLIKQAKSLIEEGALGDVVAVNGQFWLYKPTDYFDATWRRMSGGGPLLINCVHDIDLLRYLVGDMAEIQAMRSALARGFAVEDTAGVLIRFSNGALGTFSVSDTVVAPWSWEMTSGENPIYPQLMESCYRIGGTRASLSIPDMSVWTHDGDRSWWSPMSASHQTIKKEDAFQRQFSHFLEVLEGSKPPLVSAREGYESLAATLSCVDTVPLMPANPT